MFFLVIYQLIPEHLLVYRGYTEDKALMAKIRECHGKFVNSSDITPEVQDFIVNMPANLPNYELVYDDSVGESSEIPMLPPHDYAFICTGQIM